MFQARRQRALESISIDAIAQLQVNAREFAQSLELPLSRCDVHDRETLADAGALQRAGHAQHGHLAAGLQP